MRSTEFWDRLVCSSDPAGTRPSIRIQLPPLLSSCWLCMHASPLLAQLAKYTVQQCSLLLAQIIQVVLNLRVYIPECVHRPHAENIFSVPFSEKEPVLCVYKSIRVIIIMHLCTSKCNAAHKFFLFVPCNVTGETSVPIYHLALNPKCYYSLHSKLYCEIYDTQSKQFVVFLEQYNLLF